VNDLQFIIALIAEIQAAREKFPETEHLHAAFQEETGEVAKALFEIERGEETYEGYLAECVQAAAMAMRLATEGDPDFPGSVNCNER
jgi:hypothetical protein